MTKRKVKEEEQAEYMTADDEIIQRAFAILDARVVKGAILTDPTTAGQFFKLWLQGLENENFGVLLLNSRHQMIHREILFTGTIDGAEVHPREVVKYALKHNAAALILGHNHPSGNPEPSVADRTVTTRLKQSLALVDVRLLDHFIIGDGPPVSMAARGWV